MNNNKTPVVNSPYIGEKVRLRAPEKEDVYEIMRYWNTYETRLNLNLSIPMSSIQEMEWIELVTKQANERRGFSFVIEDKNNGKVLGTCSLHDINWIDRTAILGIGIHNPEDYNKGYGTDTMKCLLAIGFKILNLHRIELLVYETNKRAIKVYEKVGFKEVGRKRKNHFYESGYIDTLIMDILEEEYRNSSD